MDSGRRFYRISGWKYIRMQELIFRGSNLAICPFCGNGNAMFFGNRVVSGKNEEKIIPSYSCRDCGNNGS